MTAITILSMSMPTLEYPTAASWPRLVSAPRSEFRIHCASSQLVLYPGKRNQLAWGK